MKNMLMIRSFATLLLTGVAVMSYAQSESDLARFLSLSAKDASTVIAGYTTPAIRATSYGTTAGWYHTAKTHKKLGVDLGVTLNTIFVPTSDNYFVPGVANFQNNTTGSQYAPTIFGPKETTTYTETYTPQGSNTPVSVSFNGPEGLDLKKNLGFSAVPVPMVQLGIGLIKNTDLKLRMIPSMNRGSTNLSMFGVGLLHDIKQYFPGVKVLPFDLSVLAAYNSFTGKTGLANSNASNGPTSTDGNITYKMNSWTLQVLISKKISVLTLYAGAGYAGVATKVSVNGTYQVTPTVGQSFSVSNPVGFNVDNSGMRVTGGIRFKFGPLYLNGDYTVQKYNTLSLGLGFSVR